MSTSPDGIYEKGIIDPGLPVSSPTNPFWLSQPSKLSKHQSPWPSTADIIIVGSGMTAASLTNTLYALNPAISIVIVEARDLCSGATGRNGGHCKVMSPGVWFERKEAYGVEEALRVMRFEHGHLSEFERVSGELGIECDLRLHEGVDVYHDQHIFDRAVRALEDMRAYAPDLANRYTVYKDRTDLDARHCPEQAIGAIGMPSGSMWPYKFVTGLFEHYINNKKYNINIQTNTPVTDIIESPSYATIKTPRGSMSSPTIIHATNAWMSHLIPALQPLVSPVRANVQRHAIPGLEIDNSLWLRYAEHDYDYVVQRPDKSFILGRANTGRRATSDDSSTDVLPQTHLRTALPTLLNYEPKETEITHAWSGCVAFTQDGNPFVGKWPGSDRKHQWVCGAYQGIGMVRAFRAAEGLARLILGRILPEDFPGSMVLSEGRLGGLEGVITGRARL